MLESCPQGRFQSQLFKPTYFVACFRCWWGKDRPSIFRSCHFLLPTWCYKFLQTMDPINGKFLTPKVGIETKLGQESLSKTVDWGPPLGLAVISQSCVPKIYQSMAPINGWNFWTQRYEIKTKIIGERNFARPTAELIQLRSPPL